MPENALESWYAQYNIDSRNEFGTVLFFTVWRKKVRIDLFKDYNRLRNVSNFVGNVLHLNLFWSSFLEDNIFKLSVDGV